jgi:hypothetical protein
VLSLVRSRPPDDRDIRDLRALVGEQGALLDGRLTRLTQLASELVAFETRYRREVGRRHDELDELAYAIAELELVELGRQLGQERTDGPAPPAARRDEPPPRFTSDAVRKLFRDVAKAIHPDLADTEHSRESRHTLMVEANRAYSRGDERRLRAILEAWESEAAAGPADDLDALRLKLLRRLAQIHGQLEACDRDLASLEESPLWKLKLMSDDAATRGRDLIGDMVKELTRDILVARNRLDAMRY